MGRILGWVLLLNCLNQDLQDYKINRILTCLMERELRITNWG